MVCSDQIIWTVKEVSHNQAAEHLDTVKADFVALRDCKIPATSLMYEARTCRELDHGGSGEIL